MTSCIQRCLHPHFQTLEMYWIMLQRGQKQQKEERLLIHLVCWVYPDKYNVIKWSIRSEGGDSIMVQQDKVLLGNVQNLHLCPWDWVSPLLPTQLPANIPRRWQILVHVPRWSVIQAGDPQGGISGCRPGLGPTQLCILGVNQKMGDVCMWVCFLSLCFAI